MKNNELLATMFTTYFNEESKKYIYDMVRCRNRICENSFKVEKIADKEELKDVRANTAVNFHSFFDALEDVRDAVEDEKTKALVVVILDKYNTVLRAWSKLYKRDTNYHLIADTVSKIIMLLGFYTPELFKDFEETVNELKQHSI